VTDTPTSAPEGLPALLDDGSPPLTPEGLLRRLEELGIPQKTYRHAPVFTVEDSQKLKGDLPGAHTKNLFVRDKKGAMWLLVALYDRDVDLHALAKALGVSGRFSFGSADRLMRYLGVTAGSVTPFAAANDHGGAVRVALDAGLRDYDLWNAHPLDNAMTTAVRAEDMLRFLEAVGHPPVWVDV
jgi:Ala-tRNA(Pro) deacylase